MVESVLFIKAGLRQMTYDVGFYTRRVKGDQVLYTRYTFFFFLPFFVIDRLNGVLHCIGNISAI